MTIYFGRKWDAPRVDNATQVATPVDQMYMECDEPVTENDRGLMIPYVGSIDAAGRYKSITRPVHLECDLRSMFSHIAQQCTCFTQHATLRDEARATLDVLNARRAEQGMGSL